MDTSELLNARTYLIEQFRKELLGPGSEISYPDAEHEIITDLPEVRYSVGILYPQRNPIGLDNDVPDNISEKEDHSDLVEAHDDQADQLPEEDNDDSVSEVIHGENALDERETLSLDDTGSGCSRRRCCYYQGGRGRGASLPSFGYGPNSQNESDRAENGAYGRSNRNLA